MTCEVLRCLLMDIVGNSMEVVFSSVARVDSGVNPVLSVLDQIRCYVVVIWTLLASVMRARKTWTG